MKTLCNCVNTCIVKTIWVTTNVVRFRGVVLKSFRKNRKLVPVPEKRGFYTMKIEAEESGPSQLSGFEGIPVYWGFGFEGFHCILNIQLYLCFFVSDRLKKVKLPTDLQVVIVTEIFCRATLNVKTVKGQGHPGANSLVNEVFTLSVARVTVWVIWGAYNTSRGCIHSSTGWKAITKMVKNT